VARYLLEENGRKKSGPILSYTLEGWPEDSGPRGMELLARYRYRAFVVATFKRTSSQSPPSQAQAPEGAQAVLGASRAPTGIQPKPATKGARDSHPAIRAKARQHTALQRLNAPARGS
jgi:hypothetical protein